MENYPQNVSAPDNGKTIAIVSYITLIGWIVALIMNSNNKTSLGSYHIRQSLMLMIVGVIVSIVNMVLGYIPFVGTIIGFVLCIGLIVLWVIGLINAINGQEKPIPVIGEKANDMLKGVA